MKYLMIILTLSTWSATFGQVDYLELKDQHSFSCGTLDSAELVRKQKFLDSISRYEIAKGEEKFLYDFGMTYFKIYLKWSDKDALIKSTKANQKCWDRYNNYNALWNLGLNYGLLQNCDQQIKLTDLYINYMIEHELEAYIPYNEVFYRYKSCCNQ